MTMTLDFVGVETDVRRQRLATDWQRPLTAGLRPALRRRWSPRPGRIALAP